MSPGRDSTETQSGCMERESGRLVPPWSWWSSRYGRCEAPSSYDTFLWVCSYMQTKGGMHDTAPPRSRRRRRRPVRFWFSALGISPTIDHVVGDIPRAENQNRTGLRRRRLDLGGAVSCIPPFVCI